MFELEAIHRRFLRKETIIAAFINAALNAFFVWLLFRGHNAIMLWGEKSIGFDLVPTIFLTAFGMTLILTPVTRRRIMKGTAPALSWSRHEHPLLRWLPSAFPMRALLLAILFFLILFPATTGLLRLFAQFPMSLGEVMLFKTCLGAVLGLVFTPIILITAMADK